MSDYSYTIQEPILEVRNLSVHYESPILRDVNFAIHNIVRPGLTQGQVVALLAPSGMGKCLAKGTPVLMFDGAIKPVEEVKVGDQLMGPDSTPRNVLGLGRGVGDMYEVVPHKGQSYTVNGPHILALELTRGKSRKSPRVEISVEDYLKQNATFKARAKTYRVGVDFPHKDVPLDPYMLGLWLADGDSDNFSITNEDAEIVDHILAFAVNHELYVAPRVPNRYGLHAKWNRELSPTSSLRALGVLDKKHIPLQYKANDREIRLQLLAGIIDGDGSLSSNCYDLVFVVEELARDVAYVARSLGLAAYVKTCQKTCTNNGKIGTYYRVCISGDTSEIPVKITAKQASPRRQIKNHLRSGFKIVPKGLGSYYGFELDGDKLFLLGDFTVTHNTQLFRCISGLKTPDSGEVYLDETKSIVRAGMVGVVAQDYPLFAHLTIYDNVMLAARRKMPEEQAKEVIINLLERFGLSERRSLYPHQISGGQRQRVAIIQQMVCSGHLLLMDEPFSGLDVIMKENVQNLITSLAAADELNTIVLTTHDIAAAIAVADTILLLGRERDATGAIIPGANIRRTIDLAKEGLAWHPNIADLPEFHKLETEIRTMFREL